MKRLWLAYTLVLAVNPGVVGRLWAASPGDQIKTTVDHVLEILRDRKLQDQGERQKQLKSVILSGFDFVEMAKRSLGSHWRRNVASREEIVPFLSEFIANAYVNRIDSHKNEKVVYLRERRENSFADVDTRIMTRRGGGLPITYKLHFIEENWKVYDIVIDNRSWVNHYRYQLNRILLTSSFEALLKKLQEKRARGDGDSGLKITNADEIGDRSADPEPGFFAVGSWKKVSPFALFLLGEASGSKGLRH